MSTEATSPSQTGPVGIDATGASASCAGQHSLCDPAPVPRSNAPADRFMRRLLRLPVDGLDDSPAAARRAFQTSIAVASVRCLLMYVFLPFVLPAIGIATGVGPVLGIAIGLMAIIAIVYSVRRFWRADHSKRWAYTVLGTAVIGFMIALIAVDLVRLMG
jgi:hypothetical protein